MPVRSREDVEASIDRSGLAFREVDPNTWILRASSKGSENIVVQLADPLLLFRVKVMDLMGSQHAGSAAELFRKLLELNAREMVHSAYGVADDAVVMSSALLLETADDEEFQSALDEMTLALETHYEVLLPFRSGASTEG